MPRGINPDILTELNKTAVGGIVYLINLTLKSGTYYFGEKSLVYNGHNYVARIQELGNLKQVGSGGKANELEITLANVDGYITTLDRQESFIGAKLELIEYLVDIDLGYVKWYGWCDEPSSIDLLTAKIKAYSGAATSGIECPRRVISPMCSWNFGHDFFFDPDLYIDSTNYDGAECRYQSTSTIGFRTVTTSGIDNTSDPVTFSITALSDSQVLKIGDELKIDSEILLVTEATSTSVTAIRAQRNTTIATHNSGATVYFANCQYSVAACKRRGMYGNNPSDTFGAPAVKRNYFGGFPLLTGQLWVKYRDKVFWKFKTISFSGNESAYGKPLPLIYGRCRLVDPTLIVARTEGDFLLALFAVGEGLLGTNPNDGTQGNTLNAYVVGSDGLENIYVNGVKRHDPRAGYGVQVSNGQQDQAPPQFAGSDLVDFNTYKLGMLGTAWVLCRINTQNNPNLDGQNISATGDFEIQYGKCVRAYYGTGLNQYNYKPTGGSPVWALLDYMTSKRSGGAIDHVRINLQSFLDVEDYRNNLVKNIVDGEDVTRWTFNGIIDNRKSYSEHERLFCLGMYCIPPYIDADGKFKIRALKAESLEGLTLFSSVSAISRNILTNQDGVSSLIKSRKSLLEIPNEVRVNYVALGSDGKWIKTQLVLADRDLQRQMGTILGDNSLRIISKTIDLPGVTTVDEAARIGTLILRAGEFAEGGAMNNLRIEFNTFYKDSQDRELGDIIQVEDALLDPVTEAYFRIIEIEDTQEKLTDGGIVFIRKISATLHLNEIYDDTAYTVSLVGRLNPPIVCDAEPPAVTNFVVTETGIYDIGGIPHSKLVFTYDEPGEDIGAIDHVGGYSAGATIMHIDGITPGTELKVDDQFRIVGHNTIYRVTAACTFIDDSADVSFTPGLEAAVGDNDVCSIVILNTDARGSFNDVAIFRSNVEDDGTTVIGDWRFVTICKKSGAFVWYDISNRWECFAAISRNLANITPDINTKTAADTYKYPRQIIKIDGVMDDAGNPSGASGLELIVNSDDNNVPVGSGYFKFNRETSNYKSIYGVMVVLQPGGNNVAHGPYQIERSTFPTDVLESGNNCCIVDAGVTEVVINGGRTANNAALGRVLLIHNNNVNPDANIDGQVISSQNNTGFGLTTAFQKSGTYDYEIVKRWWDTEDSDNILSFWFTLGQIVPSLGAREQIVWQTPTVPLPEGIWKATAYARNVFGLGTRLVTAEAKEVIGGSTPHVPDDLHVFAFASGLECTAGVEAWKWNNGIYEAEFRAKWFAAKQQDVDLRTEAEGGTLVHDGDTNYVVTGLYATKNGRSYIWGRVCTAGEGFWYYAFRLKNAAGWSVWSDGNDDPINVQDYVVTTEDASQIDNGPPADWAVSISAGIAPNTAIVRATRPQTNGHRILFTLFQIKDGNNGSWRDIDANAGAAVTKYNGANTVHSYNTVTGVLTTSGNGFGNATKDDLLIVDVRGDGNFNDAYCQWGMIPENSISGNNLTLPGFRLAANASYNNSIGAYNNVRVKAVKPLQNWNNDGYFGDTPGNGLSELIQYSFLNSDNSVGDISSQEFISSPINIPAGFDISQVVARVFFENTYSRDHGDIVSALNTSGTDFCVPLVVSGNNISTDASLAGEHSEKIFIASLSANATLLNPTNAKCGQKLTWRLINTSNNEIVVILASKFRNGKAFPVWPGPFAIIAEEPINFVSAFGGNSSILAVPSGTLRVSARANGVGTLSGNLHI